MPVPLVRLPVPLVLVALLLVTAGAVLGGSVAHARPTHKLTIAQVSALLDRLSKQNEMLDERYNAAVAAVATQNQLAQDAQRAAHAAAAASVQAQERFSTVAAQQYEAGSMGAMNSTGLLLTSADPQSYLDTVSTVNYLSGQFATISAQAKVAQARSRAASQHASAELAAAQAKARAVRQQRAALEARTARFKQLLATLTEQQRRRYARARSVAAAKARAAAARQANTTTPAPTTKPTHSQPTPPSSQPPASQPPPSQPPASQPATSSAVQRVVAYAEAQVGKAYTFAGTGPDSFDCSGLTMQAWAQAGVSLPHMASAQYGVGRHVSYSELQPGDLIFLYNPIGHVEIYVGHDLAVSAADPALGVVYVHPSQDMADYVGATRPQG